MASRRARIALGLVGVLAVLIAVPVVYGGYTAMRAISAAEAQLAEDLDGRSIAVAGRVYARSLTLVKGLRPKRVHLSDALARVGYRAVEDPEPELGEYYRSDDTWVIGVRAFDFPEGPQPALRVALSLDSRGRIAALRDDAGEALDEVRIEPPVIGFLGGDDAQDRIPVRLQELPSPVSEAFHAIEDHRFFDHSGIDVRRIAGALVANLRAGRIVQGGSTITQQLARGMFLSRRQVLSRKIQEAVIAIALERRFSKEEILELYLNEIYLGQRGAHAVHGVGAAARFYFGVDIADVRPHQAALLAAMARGPSRYSPTRNMGLCRERRDLVLHRMGELGFLSGEEVELAQERSLDVQLAGSPPRSTRYFIDHVWRELQDREDAEQLARAGGRVFTTMDWRLQDAAERRVKGGLEDLEERAPKLMKREKPVQAALVALDPHSGDLLALIGGRDYGSTQFNRATDAKRQPGSVFKAVVALAALAPPDPQFTLASVLIDEPIVFEPPEPLPGEEPEEPWGPENHDGEYRGEVTLRQAIELSLNLPIVRLGQDVGLRRTIRAARRLGIKSRLRAVPSLALGTFEVTPIEMTQAYAVLAAGGRRAALRSVRYVTDRDGNVLLENPVERAWTVDAQGAFLVTSALEGAIDRGTGRTVRNHGYRGPVAGKTGSSDDYRDGWFIGYTPQIATGVWVGFDDDKESLGLPGSRTALPIFSNFLKDALGPNGGSRFRPPHGVERIEVVSHPSHPTGLRCDGSAEWFLESNGPTHHCNDWWLPSVGEGPPQLPGFRWPFLRRSSSEPRDD